MELLPRKPVTATGPSLVRIDAEQCGTAPVELSLQNGKCVIGSSRGKSRKIRSQTPLAAIICRPGNGADDYSWFLIPRWCLLTVNGVRPLGLAALDAGAILACGHWRWLVTSQWAPSPRPVPEALAKRECPVCGGELGLAPIVRCQCGRYYHLENPRDRDNPALLNCYLSGPCGLCGAEPSLESKLFPEPDEKLLSPFT